MPWITDQIKKVTPERLLSSRWLKPFAHRLAHPEYWRLQRKPVARAAATGAFFAFATPVAQIPLSLGAGLLFRMHLPTAVVATLINTPVTFGPVYYAAYRLGAWLLQDEPSKAVEDVQALLPSHPVPDLAAFSWSAAVVETMLGAFIFGLVAAGLAYLGVLGAWRLRALRRLRRPHNQ